MTTDVRRAYENRAGEYIEALGAISSVHPVDERLISNWATSLDGPVLDAGCGPGHWTAHLVAQGVQARGLDQVPMFVENARRRHPNVSFALGDLEALPDADASLGGVLSWYSLIHHAPETIHVPLQEFARALRPGGSLLLGFFEWPTLERFDHAVVDAYRWPVDSLATEVEDAGFVVQETHVRKTSGQRPHGALMAHRLE